MDKAELLDAGPEGSVAFRFTITQRYANLNGELALLKSLISMRVLSAKGVLHGGAAGVLFDMFTTIALGPIARPGYWEYACLSDIRPCGTNSSQLHGGCYKSTQHLVFASSAHWNSGSIPLASCAAWQDHGDDSRSDDIGRWDFGLRGRGTPQGQCSYSA